LSSDEQAGAVSGAGPASATEAVSGNGSASADGVLLDVTGVSRRFGGIRAVDGATFDVKEGSITALIGPNGAGKTTLFNVVTGFYKGDSGAVQFDGKPVFGLPPHALARRGMVRTFQITKALARISVLDNMLLGAQSHPGERFATLLARPVANRRREQEARDQARELLKVFNLERLADEYAGTLSGGQRKLLELARSLMARPRLLMLDEPMAGVNPSLGARLLEHMERLRSDEGMTFLFVEHDMEVVMTRSDTIVVMAQGQVIASGPPDEIQRDQGVIDAYLGGPKAGEGTSA
jgi:branched-chain amino acid transport system ATP-binding protein